MNLACLVIAAAAATGQVDATTSGENPLQEASWLIGTWEAQYELPGGIPELGDGGEPVKDRVTWRWALKRKVILFRSRMKIEGQPDFTGLEVTGVDPTSGEVTCTLFNSTGGQGRGEWSQEGETLLLNWTVTQPDATVFKGVSYIRQQSADTYVWGMKNVTRAGEKIADWGPVTYRKRPSESEPRGLDVASLIGGWKYVSGMKNGETLDAEHFAGQTVDITKDTFTLMSGEKFVMTYEIDNSRSPAVVKFTITESPFGAGATSAGVIGFKEGKLQVCYAPMGGDPPTKFEAQTGSGHFMFVLEKR